MQEFAYYNENDLEFPLQENIKVITNINKEQTKRFIISNSKELDSELVAPEIDYYIKNSKDDFASKIKNVTKLYEINSTKYDFAQDIPQSQKLSNSLMIIYEDEKDYINFTNLLLKDEFELYKVEEKLVKEIKNSIGNFEVIIKNDTKEIVLKTSQIVWFNQKLIKSRSGIFDPNVVGLEKSLEEIKDNLNGFAFKKTLTYDSTICQFHERKDEICSKCEAVCPTNAITKIVKDRRLVFSYVDCILCGECVSVCPSGAMDYAELNRDTLYKLSLFYKKTHPLIISSSIDLDNISTPLKENVFPLCVNGDIFDESTLLTFLQISESQLIYFSKRVSIGTKEAIKILNDIYQKKYNKTAIYMVENEEELQEALNNVEFIEGSYLNFDQTNMKKREVFSQRLEKIVEQDDFGVVETGPDIHYGRVLVNDANCTLCLSCVAACNVDALFANEADFTLRVNPSLCTACGYCEVICPEKDCLTIAYDKLELNPTWFKESILAKDTLFACVECGKEFATTKAIEKIASLMGPAFAKFSEAKKRTLYCCEECKPKVMIKQGLLDV